MMVLALTRRLVLSRFLWILLVLVALGLATNRWVEAEGGPRHAVQQWDVWAPLASFTIQTITTMTPIGAVFIAVVNGILFKLFQGLVSPRFLFGKLSFA